jgi:hypothetical protein
VNGLEWVFERKLVTFRTYLLAVGFVWSTCALNALLAIAAPWSGEGSAQQSVSAFDLLNKNATAATVEDVQRILAEDKSKPDAKVARQLSGLELTERMSYAKLKSLEQGVPGTKSRWALVALADASVFLDPAAAEALSQAPPDLNEQQRMLALIVEYLAQTLPKLPNFYATRITVRFEDMQSGRRTTAVSRNDSSWRQVGSSRVVVAYRDGKEVIDPREWGKHPHHPEGEGLITRGTFGPIFSMVIVDAAHGGFTWSRWERGSAGTLAVFRYRVPQNRSHYSVGFRGLSSDKGDAAPVTGYHGEVAIDPATGTILFLTLQADQSLSSPILRSDVMVEYGPVEIGGKTYTCPIRSVSIGLDSMGFMGVYPFGRPTPLSDATLLNDVTFGDYHQFRSDSRILTGNFPAPDH